MATVKDRPQSPSGESFLKNSAPSQFPDQLNSSSPHSLFGIKMMQIDDILSQREHFIGTIDFDVFYLHRRYINTSDKFIRIYHCQICAKNITPKASIVLIHGFSQHLQYHLQTAIQFALNGYDCHLFDLRGFGYSTGPRCSNVISNYQKDLHDVLLQVRKDKPCFLYAHSMGGLVAVSFIMKNPHIKIAGVILNGPLLELHPRQEQRFPESKQRLVAIIAKNANDFLFTVGLNPGLVSKNSWMMHKIFNDKRQVPITTASQIVSWLSMFKSIKRGYKKFKTPILICHGTQDMLCDVNSSINFIKNISSDDKIVIPIKGAYHHLQMEPEASEILVLESLKFMSKRLDKIDEIQNIGDPEPVFLGTLKYPKENAVVKSLRYIGYSFLLIIVAFLLYCKFKYGLGPSKVWMFLKFVIKRKFFGKKK